MRNLDNPTLSGLTTCEGMPPVISPIALMYSSTMQFCRTLSFLARTASNIVFRIVRLSIAAQNRGLQARHPQSRLFLWGIAVTSPPEKASQLLDSTDLAIRRGLCIIAGQHEGTGRFDWVNGCQQYDSRGRKSCHGSSIWLLTLLKMHPASLSPPKGVMTVLGMKPPLCSAENMVKFSGTTLPDSGYAQKSQKKPTGVVTR